MCQAEARHARNDFWRAVHALGLDGLHDRDDGYGGHERPFCFVEVDFDRDNLVDRLMRAGFDAARRTVVVWVVAWDGVTNYLQAISADTAMRWVGNLAPASQIIFTYIDAGVLDGSSRFDGAERVMQS